MVASLKVLVVDDDPVIQRLLQVNFEMEDYVVVTADDGAEGLEAAQRELPDVILLDVMMPRMDGMEVARRLRADDSTAAIPIVLLTAKAQSADIADGKETGADAYVTKPFDPIELLDTVKDLIG